MTKILMTYATRPLGLRISKYLGARFAVEKCSSDDIPSVLQATYTTVPRAANPVFAHEMLKLALDKGCDALLPLGLDEIRVLSEAAVLFEEYGVRLLCPSRDMLPEINVLIDPAASIGLQVLLDRKDMLTDKVFEYAEWDGLCLVSDSEDEFILAVV